jgi:hypothetical protein
LLCEEGKQVKLKRKKSIRLLDAVALAEDVPKHRLKRGEVGTVVEILAPRIYEVEFCDDKGRTYAELALSSDQLVALHNRGEALRIVA